MKNVKNTTIIASLIATAMITGCANGGNYAMNNATKGALVGAAAGAASGALYEKLKDDSTSKDMKKTALKAGAAGAIIGGGTGYMIDQQ